MKILYAVQATGNGHISRASEILPLLQKYGQVDVMLSGTNAHLPVDLPVKHRSKGLSLFYRLGGGLNYLKMLKQINPFRIWADIKRLPVESYDLVINDFDFITSMACKIKRKFCIHWGHQASFHYLETPRPEQKSLIGEWVLKHFTSAELNIGLHFKPYHKNILPPIIKDHIRMAHPSNQGHITVYLAQYDHQEIYKQIKSLTHLKFHIFSNGIKEKITVHNCQFFPLGKESFTHSMIHANGVITGGGFETPAEALFLKKRLMVIPIKGQYEQKCNAEALREFGAEIIDEIDIHFGAKVDRFFNESIEFAPKFFGEISNKEIVDQFMRLAIEALNQHNRKSPGNHQDTELPGATAFEGLINTNFPSASSAIKIMP
jgi:uncharacterized protein (TIGR00661 family)